MTPVNRKPRIALMGEFSAGKSTLSNLLLGARPLPQKVTATRLSPVWMSMGTGDPYRVDVDGTEEPVSLDRLDEIPVDTTRVIRLFFEAEILNLCDLIDFPGISDPNMASQVWERMLDEVDAIVWCTHATQAWRQSEASVWNTIPEAVRANSILLVTKFDKLTTERDGQRVLARLAKETEGLFAATFPISLTSALAAGDDYAAFEASGGIAFLEHLLQLIETLSETTADTEQSVFASHATLPAPRPDVTSVRDLKPAMPVELEEEYSPADEATQDHETEVASQEVTGQSEDTAQPKRIVPRRVRPKGSPSPRPGPGRRMKSGGFMETSSPTLESAARAISTKASRLRSIFQESPVPAED
ncbi:dynamin family protein [Marivita hallyeonensis]|uniref:Dynamin family protein n=1 Tax=Marivita hallyeonensis TaxID=996342 RepID=A0A1M5LQI7_9RHOB|nr:dynamin family protein [Marivita hallyeonensis]SHG67384.1 Dynamin family protein [Marivita hallyeonensis]